MLKNNGPLRCVLLLVLVIGLILPAFNSIAEPTLAPDWTLNDPSGSIVDFHRESAERPAVLLFWATWCPYCRALMPHLEKVRRDYATKGVDFYALNVWEDSDPVAYLSEHDHGFRLLLNADSVAKDYGIKGSPGLVVVNQAKNIVYRRNSGTSPSQVETDLRGVLDEVSD
ncbi:MAG: cytochrome c biogenesis protein CcmG/thiol:disulfide interchange protein DsbE [Gammaproteobacteria bacterium]|jgi:cytochrome c biogenesis protein CcmG/thiol:disulfide interchange protein DsbE